MLIRVSGWEQRAGIDGPASLEDFEMKVISCRAPGGSFEPERLTDGDVSAIRRCERVEMAVEKCPTIGVKNPVRAETADPPHWIDASDPLTLIAMEDAVSHRDHHRVGRADEINTGVGMLPRGVAEALADIHRRAIHRSPDNRLDLVGARNRSVAPAGRTAHRSDQGRRGGNERATNGQSHDSRDHGARAASEARCEQARPTSAFLVARGSAPQSRGKRRCGTRFRKRGTDCDWESQRSAHERGSRLRTGLWRRVRESEDRGAGHDRNNSALAAGKKNRPSLERRIDRGDLIIAQSKDVANAG